MVFSSFVFLLLFLPLTLGLYFAAPLRWRNAVLFIVSLAFYAWGEPLYILLMLFSTVFDYGNGLALEKLEKKNKARARKGILLLSLAVNLGMLCFFKYTPLLIQTADDLGGLSWRVPEIALPIGISFYTFQTLSYTIDVYRGNVKAQHRFVDFAMYVSLFPQLIAGPIVRYADIEKQLPAQNRRFQADEALGGAFRFAVGLGKKVLLANQFGTLWSTAAGDKFLSAAGAWLGTAAFALQIYFDFSGYSDMAIGLARIFGFRLKENFRYPYTAVSVTDFWRRWHISLGNWFREYVYIPLGGNRKGLPRQALNLLIVWSLTGLWHGAAWNYLLWGLYFFVLLLAEKLFLGKWLKKLPAVCGHLYTLVAVLFSLAIFAVEDFASLGQYLGAMFGSHGFWQADVLFTLRNNALLFILGIVFATELPRRCCYRILQTERSRTIAKTAVGAVLCALSLLFLIGDSYNPFLYFRF